MMRLISLAVFLVVVCGWKCHGGPVSKVLTETAKRAGKEAAKRAAKEAAEEAARRAAKEVGKRAAKEAAEEAAKRAAKEAGKRTARQAGKHLAVETAKKCGDDVLKVTMKRGGAEVLEQGARHADDLLVALAKNPQYTKILMQHGDELLPLVQRLGPKVLEFEAKHPGLAGKVVTTFGDDALKLLGKSSSKDIARLVKLAEKADGPATKKLLLESFLKSSQPERLLSRLGRFVVRHGGKIVLTTAVVGGVAYAGTTFAEMVEDVLEDIRAYPGKYALILGGLALILGGAVWYWGRRLLFVFRPVVWCWRGAKLFCRWCWKQCAQSQSPQRQTA